MRLIIIETAVLFVLFSLFVHLVTASPVSGWDMAAALGIVIITAAGSIWPLTKQVSGRRVWAVLSALAGGFWIFSLFRFAGYVGWPMGRPSHLNGYLHLLYFHFILSITILVPVLMVSQNTRSTTALAWGNWKKAGLSPFGFLLLLFSCIGLWSFTFYSMAFTIISATGPPAGFVLISLLKAFLTGVTEEISYRGIFQSYAIEHLNVPLGILLQSCLFTVFHFHLGAAFFPKTIFLGAVMALGLIFGVITRYTSGIGWACVIHIAINAVIEWQNLS